MFDRAAPAGEPTTDECLECGERPTAANNPVECDDCGRPGFQVLGVSLD